MIRGSWALHFSLAFCVRVDRIIDMSMILTWSLAMGVLPLVDVAAYELPEKVIVAPWSYYAEGQVSATSGLLTVYGAVRTNAWHREGAATFTPNEAIWTVGTAINVRQVSLSAEYRCWHPVIVAYPALSAMSDGTITVRKEGSTLQFELSVTSH